jgi:tripartite-type tricarboxylate transporter receptor subunit TctC
MFRVLAVALLFAAGLVQGAAISTAGSFEGKTITYIISTKPGGGYDDYGRLIAKYMEKHLPGTTFSVKNLPGAGQRVGAETIYGSAPDGLTIGTFNNGLIYGQIAGVYGDKLDLSKMSWIGKAASDSRVVVVAAKSGFVSVDDFRKAGRPLKVAVNGKSSSSHFESVLLAKLLNLNFQNIFGYEGNDGTLGLMRGDVDVNIGSRSSLQSFVDSGEGRIVLGFGSGVDADVPQLSSLITPEGEQKAILALIESQGRYTRVTAGPPGMPADILKELRDAYLAALADPALLAEAATAKLPIVPAGGDELAAVIASSLQLSPEIVAEIKSLVETE